MKRPIVVFDFDKTLTEKDTIFGFYRRASDGGVKFKIYRALFFVLAILAKLKVLSNYSLKKWGVSLFLRKRDKKLITKIGEEYASQITMSSIYYDDFKEYAPQNVIVMSASFEEYLKPLFPEYRVVGSKILFDMNGTVVGLERNLFGTEKLRWLHAQGIDTIDILYTDSYSDKPLMDISRCVYLVENNGKKLIKGEGLRITDQVDNTL